MPLTLKYNLETGHPTPLPPAVGCAGVGLQTCFIPVMAKFAGMSWEEIYNTFWSLPVPNHCMNNLSHSKLVILWEAVAKINQVSKLKEISFSLLKKSFCWSFIKLVKKKKLHVGLNLGERLALSELICQKTFKWARARCKSRQTASFVRPQTPHCPQR